MPISEKGTEVSTEKEIEVYNIIKVNIQKFMDKTYSNTLQEWLINTIMLIEYAEVCLRYLSYCNTDFLLRLE